MSTYRTTEVFRSRPMKTLLKKIPRIVSPQIVARSVAPQRPLCYSKRNGVYVPAISR